VELVISGERFVIQPLDNVIYSLDAGGDHKQDCNPHGTNVFRSIYFEIPKKYR
jgi:hypothetical protein